MASRVFWKGYLKLSLVTCPVGMMPATSDREKVRFRTLNSRTGNPVVARYVDSVTGKAVDEENEARGYPRGEDDLVILEEDELSEVALESTRTIDIDTFVANDSIGWIWYDTPHYLKPGDKVGEEAFSVIREAMAATETVGIARLVMYRRERAIMLKPCGKGIILWTLRYGDEVRNEDVYFAGITDEKPDATTLRLFEKLIEERTSAWDPAMVHDPVQEQLLHMIAARKKGRKRKAAALPGTPPPDNVVNIMDALRKSIRSEKPDGK
ncbi:MAG: Ku protein [Sphingomonadaceae bacterium]